MDKMKRTLRDLSLPGSLVLYIAIFVMLALVLSVMTNSICERAAESIRTSYPASGEKYYLTNEQGERLGDGVYIGKEFVPLSPSDERTINLLKQIPLIAAPVYSALCIIAAALLFYRKKLRKPLAELRTASEKISNNDLDFSIGYDSKDELGRLVGSFETMRAMLANNFSEMWRQVEERKRLNAAFAHDLRTPLTVLKGYNEMLQASEHVQTKEIAATMGKHLARMEAYVNSMSNLRRLEDTRPEYKSVPLQQFLSSLQESAKILCTQNGKKLLMQYETVDCDILMDKMFVSEVCNNLIANAVRFAQTSITLSFSLQGNGLLLSVSDDGKGFDKKTVHKVTSPYFTEETERSEHFGLGLYICKLLCENYGGYLKIADVSNGARVHAFFKIPSFEKK